MNSSFVWATGPYVLRTSSNIELRNSNLALRRPRKGSGERLSGVQNTFYDLDLSLLSIDALDEGYARVRKSKGRNRPNIRHRKL